MHPTTSFLSLPHSSLLPFRESPLMREELIKTGETRGGSRANRWDLPRVRWVAKLLFSSVFRTSLTTVTITQRINYINGTNKVWLHPRLGPPTQEEMKLFVTTFSWIKSECDMSFPPSLPCLHSYPHLLLSFCSYCSDAFYMWFWLGFHKI